MAKITLQRIGPLLRERRGKVGLRETALQIGISPATLSRIEGGKLPDLETFSKICRWLQIDPAEVLGVERATDPTVGEKTGGQAAVRTAHLRADRTPSPQLARALAEMILVAQRALETDAL